MSAAGRMVDSLGNTVGTTIDDHGRPCLIARDMRGRTLGHSYGLPFVPPVTPDDLAALGVDVRSLTPA